MIQKFVESQHRAGDQGQRYTHSLFGDKISLYAHQEKDNVNQLKRFSVNYPIQATASHLAGIGSNRTARAIYAMKLPIIPFGFTHDAGDYDFPADYLFDMLTLVVRYMQDEIVNEFGVPVKVDFEIGKTGDALLELNIHDRSDNIIKAEVEGTETALKGVQEQFRKSNMEYEIEVLEEKEEHLSRHFLFMAKRAFSEKLGSRFKVIKAKLVVRMKERMDVAAVR